MKAVMCPTTLTYLLVGVFKVVEPPAQIGVVGQLVYAGPALLRSLLLAWCQNALGSVQHGWFGVFFVPGYSATILRLFFFAILIQQ